MKIAAWNVNSIRVRQPRVLEWLDQAKPDVLCLQELKCEDQKVPAEEFAALGYQVASFGQKTYNGVAILSRFPLDQVERGFGDPTDDVQARFIVATTGGIRVMSAYIPNGESVGSDKYTYKLQWLHRLYLYLQDRRVTEDQVPTVLCGDFNIAPEDLDIHDPELWEGQVLCTALEREALARIQSLGLTDSIRLRHPGERIFTWWDYRQLGFQKNHGLRIDHLFVSPQLVSRIVDAGVDRNARKGQQPSDHGANLADALSEHLIRSCCGSLYFAVVTRRPCRFAGVTEALLFTQR